MTYFGKTYEQALGTRSRAEAEKRMAEFVRPFLLNNKRMTLAAMIEKMRGVEEEVAQLRARRVSMEDALEHYMELPEVRGNTESSKGAFRSNVADLAQWLKKEGRAGWKEPLGAITKEDAAAYLAERAAALRANTYNVRLAALRRFWAVVGEWAGATANPFEKQGKITGEATPHRALTEDETRRLLVAIDASGDRAAAVAVRISLYCGLRIGDALALNWGDVDMEAGTIAITPAKTRKHGTRVCVPINSALRRTLDNIEPQERNGAVAGQTSADRLRRIFNEACAAAGIDRKGGVSFHSLRATFVSLAINNGAPLAVVQALVGHTTARMTDHYYHQSNDAARAAVAAIPEVEQCATPSK